MNSYSVKNVRSFRGREGYGFNASLYRAGKRVAFVIDHADGGMLSFEWCEDVNRAQEQSLLDAHAASLPRIETPLSIRGNAFSFQPDADAVVNQLVDTFLQAKDLKSLLKRKLVMLEGGQLLPGGTPSSAQAYQRTHPTARVLNLLPFDEAFSVYMQYGQR